MKNNFDGANVLITGGTGMIGRSLVELLKKRNANIYVVDLKIPDDFSVEGVHVFEHDLRYFGVCQNICENMDYVFHLAGVKGSPKMCMENPANFFVPMLQFNTNMMEAARLAGVKWYLFTSSVGVYHPAEIFEEGDVWKTFPSENDRFAGWAKRMGELQAEAYSIQYNLNNTSIVRPANVYGKYDNFNPETAMVIPSLIKKGSKSKMLKVWGDGTPIRDFIHADDVAAGMVFVVENKITHPINLGSGEGVSIRTIAEIIADYFKIGITWVDAPTGDVKRILSMDMAHKYGFYPTISINEGIRNTIEWYLKNKDNLQRYDVFMEEK